MYFSLTLMFTLLRYLPNVQGGRLHESSVWWLVGFAVVGRCKAHFRRLTVAFEDLRAFFPHQHSNDHHFGR